MKTAHLTLWGIVAGIAAFLVLASNPKTAPAMILVICMLILLVLLVNYQQVEAVFFGIQPQSSG